MAVADIHADGCPDLAAFGTKLVGTAEVELSLFVAWGASSTPFAARTVRVIETLPALHPWGIDSTRDSATNVVRVTDLDGDGKLDVVTSLGVAFGSPDRALRWEPALAATYAAHRQIPPVEVLRDANGGVSFVRPTPMGGIERCQANGTCKQLALPGSGDTPVTELLAADFDRDGAPDLLVGRGQGEGTAPDYRAWLFRSRDGYATPIAFDGMHAADIEVGDVDGDGHPDVVSQMREFISDFPSYTDIWLSRDGSFVKAKTIYNRHNHNDNMALVDVDNDRCLDIVQVGVDEPAPAYFWGNCRGDFARDDRRPRPKFEPLGATFALQASIGIQQADLDGDGRPELVLRSQSKPAPGEPRSRSFVRILALPSGGR